MAHTKTQRRGVFQAFVAGLLAVVMVATLQIPTLALAAETGPQSSLKVEPHEQTISVEYGTQTNVSINVTSNLDERVAILSDSTGVSLPSTYVDVLKDQAHTITVTLNPGGGLAAGTYPIKILFMPQQNRAGMYANITLQVTQPTVNLQGDATATINYGQTVNAQSTTVQTDKGAMSLAALGLTCNLMNGLQNAGTYEADLTSQGSNYAVNVNGHKLKLTVNKTTPALTAIKGSNLTAGSFLRDSRITGTATNPNNNKPVEGTWTWMSPETKVSVDSGNLTQTKSYQVRFTPTDTTNYSENYNAYGAVLVMSSGGPSGGGQTGSAADPQLNVTGGTFTYDHAQHGAKVERQGVGNYTVTYLNKDTGATTTNPPVDAGTYTVTVTLSPTVQYNGATATTTITINKRLANLKTTGDAIQSRPYNGSRVANVDKNKIKLDNVFPEDKVGLNIPEVTANFGSENVGDYTVLIQCPGATLTGEKAGNYVLTNKTVSERATIFKRPARVDFGREMVKEYGQTFNFGTQGSTYTIEQGNESGTSGVLSKDLRSINLTSTGASATAAVGTYPVTALGAGANYDLQVNGTGSLRVTKATPTFVSASAGSGKIGAKLSSIPAPTVTYVNTNNGEAVPGKVTWTNPNQTIGTASAAAGSTASYGYTFTPSNQGNYNVVTGTVSVTATAKTPVNIQTTNTTFTYDGQPHGVSISTSTQGATISITYEVDGKWTTTQPVNVGGYKFRIKADLPDSAEYADNEIDGMMTISKLTPTGQPKVSGSGETLSAYKLDGATITGVGGKKVSGTVSWDNPSATVKAGDKYAWTFKSDDGNYNDTKGTLIPKPLSNAVKVDKAPLQAAVTNAYAVLGSAQVSSNGLDVEPTAMWITNAVNDVLMSAIASANNCVSEGGATQRMVDEALNSLNTAMNSFRASMQPGLKGTDKEAVDLKESTIVVPQNRYDANPGDDAIKVKVGGEGDGEIFAFSDSDAVATAVVTDAAAGEIAIKPLSQGTAIITVGRAATKTYKQASLRVGVVVGEAPAEYAPPTEESVDQTKPVTPLAPEPLLRLYNQWTTEHMYVPQNEAAGMIAAGWQADERKYGTAEVSDTPVYCLYNPYTFEHHYTTDKDEYDRLIGWGWEGEGTKFFSDDGEAVPVYRLYNPYKTEYTHVYTADPDEYQSLIAAGMQGEGVAWYYVAG